jgi:Tol biopolymer transport system component
MTGAALAAQPQMPVFRLVLVDRAGAATQLGQPPPGLFAPRISHDGRRIAFDTGDGKVWVADLSNIAAARQLGSGRFPTWSPDDRRLLFAGPDAAKLFWQAVDGAGSPELLNDTARAPETWSTTPNLITYITRKDNDDYDIWAFAPAERVMRPFVTAPTSAELSGRFSPDGKWFAYASNASGTFEIYVEPYPRTGVKTKVTSAGGDCPMWSPDGREIFYDRDHALYAMTIRTSPRVETGPEIALPIKGFQQTTGRRRQWDITPDGRQFLIVLP